MLPKISFISLNHLIPSFISLNHLIAASVYKGLSFSPPSFLKGVMVPSAPPDTMLTIAVNQLHKIWTWINYFRFGLPISKLYNILYLIVPSKFIMLILEFYSNSIPKYPWCIIWTSYYYCFFFSNSRTLCYPFLEHQFPGFSKL